ncbi:coiled-coil domain-containing protein 194 [Nannospalax galili]|nr:coiled-coil domain-containing protein 194 [Nannospalax galili]
MEMDQAKAQGTHMVLENGALTEALARWEKVATESARQLEEAQQRARAAEAEHETCTAREVKLRELIYSLEAELGPLRRGSHPRRRSGSRSKPSIRSRQRAGATKGCQRPPRDPQ